MTRLERQLQASIRHAQKGPEALSKAVKKSNVGKEKRARKRAWKDHQ